MMPKKLKALISVLICTACLLCSATVCSAVSETYKIDDIAGMNITLPDGMTAVTRDSDKNDKYFSLFGLNYNTTMENFKKGDIYLQGMNESATLTLTVTMTKTNDSENIKNYSLLERDKLTEVMGNFLTQNEYSSCTPDQSEDKQIVWMIFDTNVTADSNKIKAYQAHTVYDGMSVNITLQRSSGNVNESDYSLFSGIVSSVSFEKTSFGGGLVTVIIIAAALVVIILLLIFLINLKNKHSEGKKQQKVHSDNEKVLRELANKYNIGEEENTSGDGDFVNIDDSSRYIRDEEYEKKLESDFSDDSKKDFFESKEYDKFASDEEIDEILSGAHSFYESGAEEIYRASSTEQAPEPVAVQNEQPSVQEIAEEPDADEAEEEQDLTQDGLTELDEFNNDEELVRDEARQSNFENSYDFFEEAPKKKMGIISNKDIDKAQDYDVIGEIEQRASKVKAEGERQPSFAEKTFAAFAKFGRGVKSFGIHCGYFCTNVYRMIKRKRAIAKRKKLEQERRERAKARAERQNRQRRAEENGSLVKVHSRNGQKPNQNRKNRY